MELAAGIGYLIVLLGAILAAYVLIKFLPFTFAVGSVFASLQWVFTSFALPQNGPEHWYKLIGGGSSSCLAHS